jgi:hypothetical protein
MLAVHDRFGFYTLIVYSEEYLLSIIRGLNQTMAEPMQLLKIQTGISSVPLKLNILIILA